MRKQKKALLTVVIAIAALMCLSLGTLVSANAAGVNVWSVPDANGWNQHLELGGNAWGGAALTAGEDGFTENSQKAATAQSYCEAIDITKPVRLEFSLNNGPEAMGGILIGFGSSYSDCFVGVTEQGVRDNPLGDHTPYMRNSYFKFGFYTFTNDGAKSLFKGADNGAVAGLSTLRWNPDYNEGEIVALEFYIGTGEDGDDSYFKVISVGDTMYSNSPFNAVTVTRDDFKNENAVDVNGNAFVNDGTKAYFAIVSVSTDVTGKKRISQSKTIVQNLDEEFTTDLPEYALEYSTVEFEVTAEEGCIGQVSLVQNDDSEETLNPGEDGKYSFNMPRGGIKEIRIAAASVQVTYKDGEDIILEQPIQAGGTTSAPEVPTKKGYVFDGWYTSEDFDEEYDFDSAVTESITLYAKWAEGVTVTFADSEDDSEIAFSSVATGGTAVMPEDPTTQNGVFAGWFTDKTGDTPFDPQTTIDEDMTVYAVWGGTVTWQVRGFAATTSIAIKGKQVDPIDMKQACTSNVIDTAEIVWYTDQTYNTEYDFETLVTGDLNLYGRIVDAKAVEYAKPDNSGWDKNTGMQRDKEGNRITGDQYGALSGIVSDPSGYSIFALNNAGMLINTYALDVTKPIYIDYSCSLVDDVADWIAFVLTDTLSGSYLAGGSDAATNNRGAMMAFIHHAGTQEGNAAPHIQANKNCSIATGGDGTLSGVNYKEAPVKSETLAQFADYLNTMKIVIGETESYVEINNVRVLNLNCVQSNFMDGTAYFTLGSFRTTVYCMKLYQNFAVTAQPTEEKFADNVSLDKEAADFGEEVTLTVNPEFESVRYRISELKIGENTIVNPKFDEGEDGKLTYKFNMPFADTKVEVTFMDFSYVVNFNDGYTTNLVDTQYVHPGEKAHKPADPTRNGWTFAGWYSDSELTAEYDFDSLPEGDLELYAKWEKRVYTCVLMSAGEVYETLSVTGLNQKFKEPDEPTREGYVFDGWYTDEACENLYSFNKSVTDDMTLYAKWIPTASGEEDNGDSGSKSKGCKGDATASCLAGALGLLACAAVALCARRKKA